MNRIDIRKNKFGPIFTIVFFVQGSILGFYSLFMTDMFVDNPVPKLIGPLILIYCLYHSFKLFIDLVKKRVVLSISTNGIEMFDDNLKTFDWPDIRTVELKKKETKFRTNYLLVVTSDKESASIYISGLDIGHNKIVEMLNEYSKGTAANKMYARLLGSV